MTHGSLFSGIGGFDLAAEWAGWENTFHCEWNPFGQKVLKHYFPNSISYNDITKTDFTIHRGTIDILTGGFPCQPYSQAGKRLGKEDDRHLFPHMLRAIHEIQPRYVVGENVHGLINWNGGMVFDEVQTDLEAAGYSVIPVVLPACAVNAPHRRDRVWFVAQNSNNVRCDSKLREEEPGFREQREYVAGTHERVQDASYSDNPRTIDGVRTNRDGETSNQRRQIQSLAKLWESGIIDTDNRPRQPNWQNFPTQSPICGRDDGLSSRLDGITFSKWRQESIKGYGNAIVPHVAFEFFKVINQIESNQ
jgi:DNA (cytosine-5)-methyltransferase 1